jgi:hypothetical protein
VEVERLVLGPQSPDDCERLIEALLTYCAKRNSAPLDYMEQCSV